MSETHETRVAKARLSKEAFAKETEDCKYEVTLTHKLAKYHFTVNEIRVVTSKTFDDKVIINLPSVVSKELSILNGVEQIECCSPKRDIAFHHCFIIEKDEGDGVSRVTFSFVFQEITYK